MLLFQQQPFLVIDAPYVLLRVWPLKLEKMQLENQMVDVAKICTDVPCMKDPSPGALELNMLTDSSCPFNPEHIRSQLSTLNISASFVSLLEISKSTSSFSLCQDIFPSSAHDLQLLPPTPIFVDLGNKGKFRLKLGAPIPLVNYALENYACRSRLGNRNLTCFA